jgi:ABC-type glycerol-3-phosphate transport system permease component
MTSIVSRRPSVSTKVVTRLLKILVWIVLAIVAVSTIYPVFFVIANTFKSDSEYGQNQLGVAARPTLGNLRNAWNTAQIGDFAAHSFIVVASAVILITAISILAGYALTHLNIPFRNVGLVGVLALMMLPTSMLMIPMLRTVQQIGLLNNYLGLILVYCALQLPFSIYLMTAYFRRIPGELVEAANVDGASAFRSLYSVMLPLVRPGVLTLVTLNFLWLWNELLYGLLILQDPSERTLMAGLALLNGEHTTGIPLICAGLSIALVPPLLLFLFFQRNLAEGITAGAVK